MPVRAWLKKVASRLKRKSSGSVSEIRHGTGGEMVENMVEQARAQLAESTKIWDTKPAEHKATIARTVYNTLKANPILSLSFNPFLKDCANFSFRVLSDATAPLEAKVDAAKIIKFICYKPGSREVRQRVVPKLTADEAKQKLISVWLDGLPKEVQRILDIK
jgi:hypothetical protein